jgi:hypothetical protein
MDASVCGEEKAVLRTDEREVRHGWDFFGRFLRTFQAAAARQANCTLEDAFCVESSTLTRGTSAATTTLKGSVTNDGRQGRL